MARLLKCFGDKCVIEDNRFPAEEMKKISGKNYCEKCYPIKLSESAEREKLNKLLCHIFNVPFVPPLLQKQVSDYQRKHGFTLKNIRLTILYFLEVKKERFTKQSIGIVPYIHDEMIAYYKDKQRKAAAETEFSEVGVIKVKMPPPKRKYDHKQTKLINLEELANAISKPGQSETPQSNS